MLNDEVKCQLSIAYAELSALQNKLTVSPAPDVADICQLTARLKEYCSVTHVENTHDDSRTRGLGSGAQRARRPRGPL